MALLEEVDQGDSFLRVVGTDYIQYLKKIQGVLVGYTKMMVAEDTYYQEVLSHHYIHYVVACWEDSYPAAQTAPREVVPVDWEDIHGSLAVVLHEERERLVHSDGNYLVLVPEVLNS